MVEPQMQNEDAMKSQWNVIRIATGYARKDKKKCRNSDGSQCNGLNLLNDRELRIIYYIFLMQVYIPNKVLLISCQYTSLTHIKMLAWIL